MRLKKLYTFAPQFREVALKVKGLDLPVEFFRLGFSERAALRTAKKRYESGENG
jgi:hypothetical protein